MLRILLIDDDAMLRGVLAKALGYAGHEVIQAEDGQQGLDLAGVTDIDLAITDLIMPGKEGIETIVALKQAHPNLPVIAISGGLSNSKLYLEIAAKIGARKILAKPFTPSELLRCIEEVFPQGKTDSRSAG